MKIELKPGKYVLAVSGGVDSMVLLDLLSKLPGVELVIAHFNHGIRADADEDERLVITTAERYGWPFAVGKGNLGPAASEATARQARYAFLKEVQEDFEANGIVTAHHQDDLIETALINVLRGTGPSGLHAISVNSQILRPLINVPKTEILKYAKVHELTWREDSTNQDESYLRNYLRLRVMAKMDDKKRQQILNQIAAAAGSHQKAKPLLELLSHTVKAGSKINRAKFVGLPVGLSAELIAYWLREEGFRQFDRKIIDRVLVAIKTALAGTKHPVYKGLTLHVAAKTAWFERSA